MIEAQARVVSNDLLVTQNDKLDQQTALLGQIAPGVAKISKWPSDIPDRIKNACKHPTVEEVYELAAKMKAQEMAAAT